MFTVSYKCDCQRLVTQQGRTVTFLFHSEKSKDGVGYSFEKNHLSSSVSELLSPKQEEGNGYCVIREEGNGYFVSTR